MSLTTETKRPRHPEKAHKPDNPVKRKPAWIRVKAPTSRAYHETRRIVREHNLHTARKQTFGLPDFNFRFRKMENHLRPPRRWRRRQGPHPRKPPL